MGQQHSCVCPEYGGWIEHAEAFPADGARGLPTPQILICQNLRNNLMHPNEYIRGVTLRFLCRIREEEILEPLTPSILANLEHRSAPWPPAHPARGSGPSNQWEGVGRAVPGVPSVPTWAAVRHRA